MDEQLGGLCLLLKQGDFSQASQLANTLLIERLDDKKLIFAIDACSFWINFFNRIKGITGNIERADSILIEWKNYLGYLENPKFHIDETIEYCVRHGVFSTALNCYSQIVLFETQMQEAEIRRKAGLCYKKLGEYITARQLLSDANNLTPGNAWILAELADCMALSGEDRPAKVLFREAFFIDAQRVDLDLLDSQLIRCIISEVADKGYSGDILKEWIGVYGQLMGVFSVKRQLKNGEVEKIRQKIYALENEMKDPACKQDLIIPRLCNLYFWLIDHMALMNNENSRINEILMKIKILDPNIYKIYVR
ncbi:MAG: hypothetical protein MJ169_06225 [Treponema sp.]|nr:hypothetical protein [Treponema sp.]